MFRCLCDAAAGTSVLGYLVNFRVYTRSLEIDSGEIVELSFGGARIRRGAVGRLLRAFFIRAGIVQRVFHALDCPGVENRTPRGACLKCKSDFRSCRRTGRCPFSFT